MNTRQAAEIIARSFHGTYEELAPEFGYRTRAESAVPWTNVPEKNRKLMVATVQKMLESGVIRAAASRYDHDPSTGPATLDSIPEPAPATRRGWGNR